MLCRLKNFPATTFYYLSCRKYFCDVSVMFVGSRQLNKRLSVCRAKMSMSH